MNLIGDGGIMQKFNHVGMKGYQSADAFNRAVADQVAEILMEDSTARLMVKEIDATEFVKLSRIDRLDELPRKEILEAMNAGDFLRAQDIFSGRLIYETQFPYKTGTNPAMFDTFLGRLFGGFGHYPVYFATNLARGFDHMPTGQKFAMVGRYMATMYAMKKAWEFVGVDARNFLWYQPFQFEGGPYYKLMNDALASTGTSYEGKRARTSLIRSLPRLFAPGYGMISSAVKGIEALGEGKTRSAFEHFLSMPVSDTDY
jgi:hypothetical protein